MSQQKHLNRIYSRIEDIHKAIASNREQEIVDDSMFQRKIESLQIITKGQGRQSLIFNKVQEHIFHWILEQREKQVPARGICLKSRRMGVSTLMMGVIFIDALLRPFRGNQIVAHDWKGSLYLFSMAKRFWQYLPIQEKRKRPLASNTNKRLQWAAPHDSWLSVASANNPGLGSGELIHFLHWSEHAKCANPPLNDAMTSILQCVPHHWDTLVFLESTAFGAHNLFHQLWLAAESGKNDYTPIFLPWKGFTEYSLPTFQPRTKEDNEYQKLHKLTDEETNWMIWKRKNDCRNDWDQFKQEYPNSAEEAFRHGGRPWFFPESMVKLRQGLDIGVNRQGHSRFASEIDPLVEFVEEEGGNLTIYEEPIPDVSYCLGSDIAEGVGGDFTVIQVLRCPREVGQPIRQVAMYSSNRVPAEQAGVVIYQLATLFNRAFCGVEKNNQGLASLSVLEHGHAAYPQMRRGYPNLYYHTPMDRKTAEQSPRLGWITTQTSKQLMLGHFQQIVADDDLVLGSIETLNEMSGLSFDPQRNQWVQLNFDARTQLAHDDQIISMAIGLMMVMHQREHKSFGRAKDGGW